MTKLYDLCVSTRKYTDKTGNEKSFWENVGTVFEKDDGKAFIVLKAHFNPAGIQRKEGSESVVISLFKPKNDNNNYSSFCWANVKGSKLYDLCVATRKYKDKTGNEKNVWENIGAIIAGENNPYLMLKAHFNPAGIQRKEGSESIVVSLFKPKSKQENSSNDFDNSFSVDTPSYQQDTFSPDAYNPDIPF